MFEARVTASPTLIERNPISDAPRALLKGIRVDYAWKASFFFIFLSLRNLSESIVKDSRSVNDYG